MQEEAGRAGPGCKSRGPSSTGGGGQDVSLSIDRPVLLGSGVGLTPEQDAPGSQSHGHPRPKAAGAAACRGLQTPLCFLESPPNEAQRPARGSGWPTFSSPEEPCCLRTRISRVRGGKPPRQGPRGQYPRPWDSVCCFCCRSLNAGADSEKTNECGHIPRKLDFQKLLDLVLGLQPAAPVGRGCRGGALDAWPPCSQASATLPVLTRPAIATTLSSAFLLGL